MHAQQWNTTFEFPPEAVAADVALLESCGNDFALMCRVKQSKLAHNRLSVRRVIETFRTTVRVRSEWHNPSRRDRFYITLKHTVNSLLFKQWGDGTMALLDTEKAKKIQGIHFSVLKGQTGRSSNRSGQHDPAYTPLKGTYGWIVRLDRHAACISSPHAIATRPLLVHHFGPLLLVC